MYSWGNVASEKAKEAGQFFKNLSGFFILLAFFVAFVLIGSIAFNSCEAKKAARRSEQHAKNADQNTKNALNKISETQKLVFKLDSARYELNDQTLIIIEDYDQRTDKAKKIIQEIEKRKKYLNK